MGRKCFEMDDLKWNKIKGKLIAQYGTVEKGLDDVLSKYLHEK